MFYARLGSFEMKTRCCGNHDSVVSSLSFPYRSTNPSMVSFLFPGSHVGWIFFVSVSQTVFIQFCVFCCCYCTKHRRKVETILFNTNIYSEMTFAERPLKGFEFVMKLPIFAFFLSFVFFIRMQFK